MHESAPRGRRYANAPVRVTAREPTCKYEDAVMYGANARKRVRRARPRPVAMHVSAPRCSQPTVQKCSEKKAFIRRSVILCFARSMRPCNKPRWRCFVANMGAGRREPYVVYANRVTRRRSLSCRYAELLMASATMYARTLVVACNIPASVARKRKTRRQWWRECCHPCATPGSVR